MHGSSHSSNYSIQDDTDGSFRIFHGQSAGTQRGYQDFVAVSYPDNLSAPIILSSRPIRPAAETASSVPARSPIQFGGGVHGPGPEVPLPSGYPQLPSVDRGKIESFGLTSGSSATSETRSSAQAITPFLTSGQAPYSLEALFPPPGPPIPARKRKHRKPKPKPEVGAEEDEARREKLQEKNRAAVNRCRRKRKQWMDDLEETSFALESQNSYLQMEYSRLQDEMSRMRAVLISHSNCNNPNINSWIENEAKKFVLLEGDRMDAMLVNFGPLPPGLKRHESMSSALGYPASTNELLRPRTNTASISPTERRHA